MLQWFSKNIFKNIFQVLFTLEQNKLNTLILYSVIVLTGTISVCNLTLDQTLTFKLFIFLFGISLLTLATSKKISINFDFIHSNYLAAFKYILFQKQRRSAIWKHKKYFWIFHFYFNHLFSPSISRKTYWIHTKMWKDNLCIYIFIFNFSNIKK